MLSISTRAAVAIVAAPSLLAGIALAAQDRYSLQVPGGLAFADFRGYEDWQVVAVSHNGDKLATILGNPAMIEAFRAGSPGNGKPFPNGARMAKIHWTAKTAEDQPGPPMVPGALHDVDFMVKDSKPDSPTAADGDTPSSNMTPRPMLSGPERRRTCRRRSMTPSAGSPATRSWPTRITCSPPIRSGEGGVACRSSDASYAGERTFVFSVGGGSWRGLKLDNGQASMRAPSGRSG